MKKRIKWLDFAKGITIFFVVFGHSLSSIFSTYNIAPLYFSPLTSVIFTFIMPSFYIISTATDGTVFADFPTKIIGILLFQFSMNLSYNNKIFKYFENFGKYTMIIYLFHGPFVSTFRAIGFMFISVNMINAVIFSILLFIFAWCIFIYICHLSDNFRIINFLFYPLRYINNIK